MATVALKQKTDSYWELIKDADSGVKIELPIVTDEDFKLSSETLAMVADLKPMDETVDYDETKLQYLKAKYQL